MSAAAMPGEGTQTGGPAAPLPRAGHAWHLAVPAVISVATFLVIDLLLAALVGRPWGPAYPLTLDALVLARLQSFDQNLEEAALDLGASHGQVMRRILLPHLYPAILAGGAVAFFQSIENFNVTQFTRGGADTLTVYVFSKVRAGITPTINALAVIMRHTAQAPCRCGPLNSNVRPRKSNAGVARPHELNATDSVMRVLSRVMVSACSQASRSLSDTCPRSPMMRMRTPSSASVRRYFDTATSTFGRRAMSCSCHFIAKRDATGANAARSPSRPGKR